MTDDKKAYVSGPGKLWQLARGSAEDWDRATSKGGHVVILISSELVLANKGSAILHARKQAERAAEEQGGTLTDGAPEELSQVTINGEVLNPHTRDLCAFQFKMVPKYVSVSLTPEARDALKAYAAKLTGDLGQSVTLSEAVLQLASQTPYPGWLGSPDELMRELQVLNGKVAELQQDRDITREMISNTAHVSRFEEQAAKISELEEWRKSQS